MTAQTLSTATTFIPRLRRSRLSAWIGLWRQRRSLARLDAHLLTDIGVTREAAAREAGRPIWDAPRNWMQ